MAHLARMMRTPSTRLVDMGTWELSDIAKAEKTLETEELMSPALRDKATWQMLLSSAVAFTAAMGWGRAVTVMLDSDDVIDGNYNADQPIEIDWRVIPTIFYTFVVMFVVFLVMHRLHRYRDRKERRYQRWAARMDRQEQALQKAAAQGGEEADGAAQQQHQLEAERVVRWMEMQFLSQVVTNFTGGWTYSSMFMWTVLLHSFLDHERADLSATCWLLLVLHVVCTSLAVAAYEAPLRSAERLGISVDRDRLDTVAGAFTGTLAWLLAIHWMEFSEVLAAHLFLGPQRMHELKYYWGGYHGLHPLLRWSISGVWFGGAILSLCVERRWISSDGSSSRPFRTRQPEALETQEASALDESAEASDDSAAGSAAGQGAAAEGDTV